MRRGRGRGRTGCGCGNRRNDLVDILPVLAIGECLDSALVDDPLNVYQSLGCVRAQGQVYSPQTNYYILGLANRVTSGI
ncbi:MAG: hypothetical protein Hyperionvirus47_7 [Hyperionvirus sp.]|uniref:Uncharacterized protein n=1 Tax=Hyperionvirus sp. TaxID=2487770 RepID=A0A3G5ACB5_9VIRU|nr:MAG: hypothetical protein Hyperionvirus47_7 [Hyperionvirus sp.]